MNPPNLEALHASDRVVHARRRRVRGSSGGHELRDRGHRHGAHVVWRRDPLERRRERQRSRRGVESKRAHPVRVLAPHDQERPAAGPVEVPRALPAARGDAHERDRSRALIHRVRRDRVVPAVADDEIGAARVHANLAAVRRRFPHPLRRDRRLPLL
eukprot:1748-Pelagococcus_subviridis.AAC.2